MGKHYAKKQDQFNHFPKLTSKQGASNADLKEASKYTALAFFAGRQTRTHHENSKAFRGEKASNNWVGMHQWQHSTR